MFPLRDTQPSYSKPVVTVLLIVVNILVFLFEVSLDPYSRNEFIAAYGLVPDQFSFLNVLTSMFLHGGWMSTAPWSGGFRRRPPGTPTRHATVRAPLPRRTRACAPAASARPGRLPETPPRSASRRGAPPIVLLRGHR